MPDHVDSVASPPPDNGGVGAADELTPLLTEPQAAAYLNLTQRALQAWRCRGGGPRYVKISARAIRYRKSDLGLFVDERLRSSTSDVGVS